MKWIINVIRWLLVFPLMIATGSFVNFALITLISFLGKTIVDSLYYPLEYGILPGIIGFFIVRFGPVITPEYNVKTLHRIFKLMIIFELVSIFLLAPNTELTKDFLPTHLQVIKSFFTVMGGVVGIYVFKSDLIKAGAKIIKNNQKF